MTAIIKTSSREEHRTRITGLRLTDEVTGTSDQSVAYFFRDRVAGLPAVFDIKLDCFTNV
jgi:hypothetical protein